MKKEYHYTISRTDRICLVSFVVILLAWELVKGLFPGGDNNYTYIPKEINDQENNPSWQKYNRAEYSETFPRHNKYSKKYPKWDYQKTYRKQPPPSQPLSIMTASTNELISMGLSVKVAFNIQKYISSGGILSKPEDLMKIYGMDSLQLMQATPHIIYAPASNQAFKEFNKKEYTSKPKPGIVDLNTASVSDLESLNGIGNVLAERIIKFRESLGGFIHPEQLKDCYGISPEVYDQLKTLIAASGNPKMILINSTDLSALSHPYLNKKMIRLLKAYKDQHGPFANAEELKKVYPPDTTWCNKVMPYISFEISDISTSSR